MVRYSESLDGVTADGLHGFFSTWTRSRPSPDALLRILQGSDYVVLAIDDTEGRVVGYVTAISDGVSCAYIPHLKVLEQYRQQGIGSELVRQLVDRLRTYYMIDLICDSDVQTFYAKLGFRPYTAMILRNYDRQPCD